MFIFFANYVSSSVFELATCTLWSVVRSITDGRWLGAMLNFRAGSDWKWDYIKIFRRVENFAIKPGLFHCTSREDFERIPFWTQGICNVGKEFNYIIHWSKVNVRKVVIKSWCEILILIWQGFKEILQVSLHFNTRL